MQLDWMMVNMDVEILVSMGCSSLGRGFHFHLLSPSSARPEMLVNCSFPYPWWIRTSDACCWAVPRMNAAIFFQNYKIQMCSPRVVSLVETCGLLLLTLAFLGLPWRDWLLLQTSKLCLKLTRKAFLFFPSIQWPELWLIGMLDLPRGTLFLRRNIF